ncbi:Protein bir1 [Schizosaccharomyces pombe]
MKPITSSSKRRWNRFRREMCNYSKRLDTFQKKKWPRAKPTPETLATVGFYYNPISESNSEERLDNVTCYMCTKSFYDWEDDDDPLKEHITHSPSCPWAYILSSKNNPNQNPQAAALTKCREQTFVDKVWPYTNRPDYHCEPSVMAASGFVYNPTADAKDAAHCLYCDINLHDWEPDDDPYTEHKRRRADCVFFTWKDPNSLSPTKLSFLSTSNIDPEDLTEDNSILPVSPTRDSTKSHKTLNFSPSRKNNLNARPLTMSLYTNTSEEKDSQPTRAPQSPTKPVLLTAPRRKNKSPKKSKPAVFKPVKPIFSDEDEDDDDLTASQPFSKGICNDSMQVAKKDFTEEIPPKEDEKDNELEHLVSTATSVHTTVSDITGHQSVTDENDEQNNCMSTPPKIEIESKIDEEISVVSKSKEISSSVSSVGKEQNHTEKQVAIETPEQQKVEKEDEHLNLQGSFIEESTKQPISSKPSTSSPDMTDAATGGRVSSSSFRDKILQTNFSPRSTIDSFSNISKKRNSEEANDENDETNLKIPIPEKKRKSQEVLQSKNILVSSTEDSHEPVKVTEDSQTAIHVSKFEDLENKSVESEQSLQLLSESENDDKPLIDLIPLLAIKRKDNLVSGVLEKGKSTSTSKTKFDTSIVDFIEKPKTEISEVLPEEKRKAICDESQTVRVSIDRGVTKTRDVSSPVSDEKSENVNHEEANSGHTVMNVHSSLDPQPIVQPNELESGSYLKDLPDRNVGNSEKVTFQEDDINSPKLQSKNNQTVEAVNTETSDKLQEKEANHELENIEKIEEKLTEVDKVSLSDAFPDQEIKNSRTSVQNGTRSVSKNTPEKETKVDKIDNVSKKDVETSPGSRETSSAFAKTYAEKEVTSINLPSVRKPLDEPYYDHSISPFDPLCQSSFLAPQTPVKSRHALPLVEANAPPWEPIDFSSLLESPVPNPVEPNKLSEKELDMTVEQWIKFMYAKCAKEFEEACEEKIEWLLEEGKRAEEYIQNL